MNRRKFFAAAVAVLATPKILSELKPEVNPYQVDNTLWKIPKGYDKIVLFAERYDLNFTVTMEMLDDDIYNTSSEYASMLMDTWRRHPRLLPSRLTDVIFIP